MSELPDIVEGLGEDDYPDTFAGADVTADDRFVIYTTTPDDPAFRAAVARYNTENLPVHYIRSKFSFNELNRISDTLDAHSGQLARAGVNPTWWAPDVPYDAISVSLLRPSDHDLRRLANSGLVPADLTPVTRSNYIAAASAAIASAAGPNYKVQTTYGQPITAVG